MSYYKNKVAVVTGVGSGMGREMAILLSEQGCNLSICDVDAESLVATTELVQSNKVKVYSQSLDVSDRAGYQEFVAKTMDYFDQVDILINNAGVSTREIHMSEYDYHDYEKVININIWGVVHGVHEFLPHLLANKGSHIVNISSVLGLITYETVGSYILSKFGIRGYTEALRMELKPKGIHVTCVHPGLIATNIAKSANASPGTVKTFEKLGMPPRKAAKIILKGARKGKARIRVGADAYFYDYLQRIFPVRHRGVIRWLMNRMLSKK